MPQIELRPFMARTMVEDGERVKPFAARRPRGGNVTASGKSFPALWKGLRLPVVAANGSLTWLAHCRRRSRQAWGRPPGAGIWGNYAFRDRGGRFRGSAPCCCRRPGGQAHLHHRQQRRWLRHRPVPRDRRILRQSGGEFAQALSYRKVERDDMTGIIPAACRASDCDDFVAIECTR